MSTWIQKTQFEKTYQAIENLLNLPVKRGSMFSSDPSTDDFEMRRTVLLAKLALYQLFESKEAQLEVGKAIERLDSYQLTTLKPNEYPDKTTRFNIQESPSAQARKIAFAKLSAEVQQLEKLHAEMKELEKLNADIEIREKLNAEIEQIAGNVVGKIPPEDVLIYPDAISKPTINPRITEQFKVVRTAISDLLALKSNSEHIKDNMKKVREDFHQIDIFTVQIEDERKLAIERAKLLYLRKKLKSMMPSTTVVDTEEEQKENCLPSTHASRENSKSKRHASFSLETADIESFRLINSLSAETSTKRNQVIDQSQKINEMQTNHEQKISDMQANHDEQIKSINQLGEEKKALEQQVLNLSNDLEQKTQALEKMEEYNKEMERWKDKSNKHSRNLNVQITQAREQLKNVSTQADQIRWLKWTGIAMIALVGLGLSASGIGSLAGLSILSGLGLAFGISSTATGGFFLLISALFYRQEKYVVGLSKSMSVALAEKKDTSEDMKEEITQIHGNTNNLVNGLLANEHDLLGPQPEHEEVIGNEFKAPPKPVNPVILGDVKYITGNNDEHSITTSHSQKVPGWTFAECFHGIFNAGKRLFSSSQPQSPSLSDGQDNVSSLLGPDALARLGNPQQIDANDANKNENAEPVIVPEAQTNTP